MPEPSVPRFLEFVAYALIFTAGWRIASGHLINSDKPALADLGSAMAAVYS